MAFLIFGMFCALGMGGAALCRRRVEQMLPPAFFTVILILYVCGLCGSVTVGVWLVWALSAAAIAYALRSACRRRTAWTALCTPGLAAFALFFFGFWIAQTGRRPIIFDDFTHWAVVVKSMWYAGGFGNGPGTTTIFREYPPAMALLEFFFVRTGGVFRDDMLYRAFTIFLCAVQLPVFRRVTWKEAWKGLLLLPVVLVLPTVFFEEAYISIYVDPVLGLLFAYVLYTFFAGEAEAPEWIGMSLAAAVLTLTKSSGSGMALIALLVIVASKRAWRSAAGVAALPLRRRLLRIAAPFAAVLTAYVSWQIAFRSLGLGGVFMPERVSLQTIVDLLRRRGPAWQYQTIRDFYHAAVSYRLYGSEWRVTLLQWIVMLAALGVCVAAARPKGRRAETLWTGCGLAVGGAIFAGSLLAVYIFLFGEGEGTGLASMPRYMGSYLLGVFGFLAPIALEDALSRKWPRAVLTAVLCLALMRPFVNWMTFRRGTYEAQIQIEYSQNALRPFEEVRRRLEGRNALLYCVAQGSTSYERYEMRYALVPDVANGGWGTPKLKAGQTLAQALAEAWARDGYTHVYLYHIDEGFAADCAELFADPAAIAEGELYRIETDGGRPVLIQGE
jgi:hypothetical protein